ncbi:uncharacterized protein TM35_000021410 [Trypanosoma theileri]|uniref:Uncharacterized protein n=1 Tax=Trypanosoma theileri TaxID=67003 RepID=A0A1X0P7J6_9TRYP|nr:uncharacterized protein TM35_000021410 [Trypanosoma theileri]ORC92815.1 hypothetical protein TM35_000021410 [Trypanosoma theileri]
MPNPYLGNDDAARYVEYYASPRMQRDSVRRLYNTGMERRRESLRRAEEALYPTRPTTYRSQKHIEDYVNEMVYAEMFRRQKKLAELEWDLYKPSPTRYLTGRELEVHVQHMYDQQIRRKQRRERELKLRMGIINSEGDEISVKQHRTVQERDKNRELEENWRPPSAHIKYNDGEQLLVSELAAIHCERAVPTSFSSNTTTPVRTPSRHVDPGRLELLAKPLRVTPKVRKEDPLIPPFRVFGDVPKSRVNRRRSTSVSF